ncbi:MAG: NADH-plastoquinone oxidoreductase subunit K, partial [Rhodospirillaceae bacterium]
EAVLQAFLELMRMIDAGTGTAWQDYYRRYDSYLGRQQALFGADWHTPTDIIGEARHYGFFGPGTLGQHTDLLTRKAFHVVPYASAERRRPPEEKRCLAVPVSKEEAP